MNIATALLRTTGSLEAVSVQTYAGWQAIEPVLPAWRSLEADIGRGTGFFQSLQWCQAWCDRAPLGQGAQQPEVYFVTLCKKGELAAVWPFQVSRMLGGLRILSFLGGGMSEYGDPLTDDSRLGPDDLAACWDKAMSDIDCDMVCLDNLPVGSPFLLALPKKGLQEAAARYSSELDLTKFKSSEHYGAEHSRATRRSLRRKREKLGDIGPLKADVAWGGTPAYAGIVDRAFEMKRGWLKETGRRKSFFSDTATRSLFATFPSDQVTMNGAVAIELRAGNRPVACEVGFCFKGRYLSHIGAFDWTLRSMSPGRIQLDAAISWAIDNHLSSFDLLGNPTEAKDQVCDRFNPLVSYREPRTAKGRLLGYLASPRLTILAKQSYYRLPIALRRALS